MLKLERADILIYMIYIISARIILEICEDLKSIIWDACEDFINLIQCYFIDLYFIEVITVQLLKELKDYTNIFLKENAAKLLNNIYVKHAISIKKDKKILYRLIYFLSINKL